MHVRPDPATPGGFDVLPTREGYDKWAEIYDGEDNPLVALEESHVRRLLGPVSDLQVADVGCGTGRHSLRLLREGADVTALDFSTGMLSRAAAKEGWGRIRAIEHDLARPLPLTDASVDRVLCALVLDHIADLHLAFSEFRRVCRPDGWIVTSIMHPAMMLRGVQARFVDPATAREIRPESSPNQVSDYVRAAVQAGLHIDHISEHLVDAELIARSPRAAKHAGWPLLLMMKLTLPRPAK